MKFGYTPQTAEYYFDINLKKLIKDGSTYIKDIFDTKYNEYLYKKLNNIKSLL